MPGSRLARSGRIFLARGAFLGLHWAHAALFLWPRALTPRRPQEPRQRALPARTPTGPLHPAGDVGQFEAHAAVYDRLASPFTAPLLRLALRRIEPLPEGAAVLDLGCGPGRELCALAARDEVERIVGVDLSPSMCRLARSRAHRQGVEAEAITADAADLPADLRGRFDLVLASMVHHHFPDPGAVARGALAALRPGGRYCIVDYGPERTNARLAPLARVVDPGWCGFMAPDELAGLLFGAGFAEVRWSQLAPGVGVAIASAQRSPAHS